MNMNITKRIILAVIGAVWLGFFIWYWVACIGGIRAGQLLTDKSGINWDFIFTYYMLAIALLIPDMIYLRIGEKFYTPKSGEERLENLSHNGGFISGAIFTALIAPLSLILCGLNHVFMIFNLIFKSSPYSDEINP